MLYCWRRYNFRDAQFVVLFSSVQPQKHGFVSLTYLQPRTSSCIVCICTASETGVCIVDIYAASETRTFVFIFPLELLKRKDCDPLHTGSCYRLHSFWSLQHDMRAKFIACVILKIVFRRRVQYGRNVKIHTRYDQVTWNTHKVSAV